MNIEELRKSLKDRYDQFFKDMGIDPQTGIVKGTSKRFTGYPYIGRNYCNAPIRILFIPLDVGKDECAENNTYHSFQDRQDIFPDGMLDFNYHIAGLYATALFILKDVMGYQQAWEILCKEQNCSNKISIRRAYHYLPKDLMSYVAYENRYRFVTIGRDSERKGGKDRVWLDVDLERQMLMDEIELFSPNIIVFQGLQGVHDCNIAELRGKYKVIITGHPSCWQHRMNKIQYIIDNIRPQL